MPELGKRRSASLQEGCDYLHKARAKKMIFARHQISVAAVMVDNMCGRFAWLVVGLVALGLPPLLAGEPPVAEVTLKKPVVFTLQIAGTAAGTIDVPAGRVVKVKQVEQDDTLLLSMGTAVAKVPIADTDYEARLATANTAQDAAAEPSPEAPTPTPSPPIEQDAPANIAGSSPVESKQPTQTGAAIPVDGPPDSKFRSLDRLMESLMTKHQLTAATLAVRKEDFVASRGYGWMDKNKSHPMKASTPIRLGRFSGNITLATAKELVEAQRLDPDAKVFDYLKLSPPDPEKLDARWKVLKVEDLLLEQGGWSWGDMYRMLFEPRSDKIELGSTPQEFIQYLLTQPVQKTRRGESEIIDHVLLGRLIEKVVDKPYLEAILVMLGSAFPGKTLALSSQDSAVHYDLRTRDNPDRQARLPIEVLDAAAGLECSATDFGNFLQEYWLSGENRKKEPKKHSNYYWSRSCPGSSGYAKQFQDGISYCVFFNAWLDNRALEDLSKDFDREAKKVAAGMRN
jgi:CubicO group peptidase (beta-lactamase class C family)